jgi:hypothetical protein
MANQNRMNGLRMRPLMKIRIGRSTGAEREAWEHNPVVHIDIPEHVVVRKLEIQESERIACAAYEAGVRFLVWGPTVAAFHLRREQLSNIFEKSRRSTRLDSPYCHQIPIGCLNFPRFLLALICGSQPLR